ncbi:hypothetical protein WOLCODRAFT_28216 [Wolfiporia cocos MD-104 SS10]|uniref:Uncharacterized protein n=1 Tax=Wolfiporia cocos (strain MD-104) TaxID=742152 RepID=A0A2H3JE29_WOLCO|nr:hypothetical protein WOLCODRAFT_28216 [Wolfiporia cocos MD-104 SS10]
MSRSKSCRAEATPNLTWTAIVGIDSRLRGVLPDQTTIHGATPSDAVGCSIRPPSDPEA